MKVAGLSAVQVVAQAGNSSCSICIALDNLQKLFGFLISPEPHNSPVREAGPGLFLNTEQVRKRRPVLPWLCDYGAGTKTSLV